MNDSFWHQKWQTGKIGFHEPTVNVRLTRHWSALNAGQRVLVPLCGKSLDLHWLAEAGHDVVGVEFVEQAAIDFFADAGVNPERQATSFGCTYSAGRISIWVADWFSLAALSVDPFDAFYDRGALVAIDPTLRVRYVAALRGLLAANARGLVVTLDYDQSIANGPPFAVPNTALKELFGPTAHIDTLYSDTGAIAQNLNMAARGLSQLTEIVSSVTVNRN